MKNCECGKKIPSFLEECAKCSIEKDAEESGKMYLEKKGEV